MEHRYLNFLNYQIYQFYKSRGESYPEASSGTLAPLFPSLNAWSLWFIIEHEYRISDRYTYLILCSIYLSLVFVNYLFIYRNDKHYSIFNQIGRVETETSLQKKVVNWYMVFSLLSFIIILELVSVKK